MHNRQWTRGHSAGPSLGQKAMLSNAYQELAKQLMSTQIKTVGNYTLGRVIGEGSFGKVRLACHRLTGQRCAIKQIPRSCAPPLLTREIHHHRRLHHPNVVQLFEVIATENHIWLVSELCAGGELFDYLVERGRMSEGETRRILGQLCIAMAYVHQEGVVHRDLKLENILLDERCNVKIADFGFGREFEQRKLMETFCGTTGYAAPEMLSAKKYSGQEVDIWSLGIIFYTLLCGSLPFDDDDEEVMKQKIIAGHYDIPQWLTADARDLIFKILQPEPRDRPTIKQILGHSWFHRELSYAPAAESHLPVVIPEESSVDEEHELHPASVPLAVFPSSGSESEASAASSHLSNSQNSSGSYTSPLTSAEEIDVVTNLVNGLGVQTGENPPISLKHRNESQTTIKRSDSYKPIPLSRSGSLQPCTELPEHGFKFPASPTVSSLPDSLTNSPALPLPIHSRTPSRTKRRSIGSTISERMLPSDSHYVIDYLAITEKVPTKRLSTPLERRLLNKMADMGFDVGQITHSVTTDACDSTGAIWWILKRKAEQKEMDAAEMAALLRSPSQQARSGGDTPSISDNMVKSSSATSNMSSIRPKTPPEEFPKPIAYDVVTPSPKKPRPHSKSLMGSISAPAMAFTPSTPTVSNGDNSPYASPPSPTPKSELESSAKSKRSDKHRSASVSMLHRATSVLGVRKSDDTQNRKDEREKAIKGAHSGRSTPNLPLSGLFGRKSSTDRSISAKSSLDMLAQSNSSTSQEKHAEPLPTVADPKLSSSVGSRHDSEVSIVGSEGGTIPEMSNTPSKPRNRNNLFSSFKTWFNEDRRKRKVQNSGAESSRSSGRGSAASTVASRRGTVAPSPLRKPPVIRADSYTRGNKPSRRSSTASRNSSHGRHGIGSPTLPSHFRRGSNASAVSHRGTATPNSELSRPASIHSVHRRSRAAHGRASSISSMNSRHSKEFSPPTLVRKTPTSTTVRRLHGSAAKHTRRGSMSGESMLSRTSSRSSWSDGENELPSARRRSLHGPTSTITEEAEDEGILEDARDKALAKLSGGRASLSNSPPPVFIAHKSIGTFGHPSSSPRLLNFTRHRPPLRDVFAKKTDDEWEDEEDLEGFGAGFGQEAAKPTAVTSPPPDTPTSKTAPGDHIFGESRYAGIGVTQQRTVRAAPNFKSKIIEEEEEEEE